jgi:hypothetical protein
MKQESSESKLSIKRWATYSAAGVAALTSGADTAEAEITHVVVGSTWTTDNDFYYALDGSAALNFYHPGAGAQVGVFNNGAAYGNIVGFSANGFNYVSNLASGVNVSTQPTGGVFGTLAFGPGYAGSQFSDTSGFIGFSFDAGAGTQFGWARVTAAGDAPVNTYTIEEYAWGMVGESIATGQTISAVPEPSSLGLLALGAVGVLATRRKKLSLAS